MLGRYGVGILALLLPPLVALGGCGPAASSLGEGNVASRTSVSTSASSQSSASTGSRAALCGTAQAACGSGVLGVPASAEPTPQVVGNFTEVSLASFFDTQAGTGVLVAGPKAGQAAPSAVPTDWGGPGLNSNLFPPQFFPSAGTWAPTIRNMSVPFLIPAWGPTTNAAFNLVQQVSIPVPEGAYRGVWLLGGGVGNGGVTELTAHYQSGATDTEALHFTGWCQPGTTAGEFLVLRVPYVLQVPLGGGSLADGSNGCGALFAVAVPISNAHRLVSITLPAAVSASAQVLWIVALTLER